VAKGEVVLYGGTIEVKNPDSSYSRQVYNDTWAWNGSSWLELNPTLSPPPNPAGGWQGAYDPASRSMIIYEGSYDSAHQDPKGDCVADNFNGYTCPPQMWSWDGQNWRELHPLHQLWLGFIYEDLASTTLMAWGGSQIEFARGEILTEHEWSWSGADWVESPTRALPLPPRPHSFGLLSFAGSVLGSPMASVFAFGGSDCDHSNNPISTHDSWIYDGSSWQLLAPKHNPPGRLITYMTYDDAKHEIVLWGGVLATGCPLL
jgi:hypothetical protein